jgi:hypothetical protein
MINETLEQQISLWRNYLQRHNTLQSVDVSELEDHLREEITALIESGLDSDEAFLVAVKRVGKLNEIAREFALVHSDRLWKQLVFSSEETQQKNSSLREMIIVISLALAAALAFKVPVLFGTDFTEGFYSLNLSFFVLPFLVAYFVWKREIKLSTCIWIFLAFFVAILFANLYPFEKFGQTELLTILHLPMALWIIVGVAYTGTRWSSVEGRMDFIRYTGELFIYYVLIALGGMVLSSITLLIFDFISVDIQPFITYWLLPCGAIGAVIIGSWLVEVKKSVIENMAPVLTRLFTPLFALMLVSFLIGYVFTGRLIEFDRDLLIAFDFLLVVVLGLLLFSISARDSHQPPNFFDVLQTVLVISALLADTIALWTIAARITEYGFTPNRLAVLGENVILLVNLAWSGLLYLRFIRGKGSFADLERWQTNYLPVYAIWAALVVVVFPLIFSFK